VLAEIRCYLVVLLADLLLGGVGKHGAKGGATISFWDPRSTYGVGEDQNKR
jgi:hypothetical protein